MIIGLPIDKALDILKDSNVSIIYNNSDKLAQWNVQLVIAYRKENNKYTLVVGNFKTEIS